MRGSALRWPVMLAAILLFTWFLQSVSGGAGRPGGGLGSGCPCPACRRRRRAAAGNATLGAPGRAKMFAGAERADAGGQRSGVTAKICGRLGRAKREPGLRERQARRRLHGRDREATRPGTPERCRTGARRGTRARKAQPAAVSLRGTSAAAH